MKKKILILLGILLVIFIAIIGYMVVTDLKQEAELIKEMEETVNIIDYENLDMEKINERLSRTITKGDYAIVENSIKQYLSDSMENTSKIADIMNDERLVKILSADNYKADGPDFIETKAYITKAKEELEEEKLKFKELLTEEKIMSYINDKNLDEYYIELYKNQTLLTKEEQEDKTVEESIDSIIQLLNNSEEVIDFLIANKGSWKVGTDGIEFTSQKLINKYNELISLY